MSKTTCRWHRVVSGIAYTRSGPNRGCRNVTIETCSYPGFEQMAMKPSACVGCEHQNAEALPRSQRPLPPLEGRAVVMDRPRRRTIHDEQRVSSHLACADLGRLHAFAERIGLERAWFQTGRAGRFPHYDLIGGAVIARAQQAGAVIVSTHDLVRIMVAARA